MLVEVLVTSYLFLTVSPLRDCDDHHAQLAWHYYRWFSPLVFFVFPYQDRYQSSINIHQDLAVQLGDFQDAFALKLRRSRVMLGAVIATPFFLLKIEDWKNAWTIVERLKSFWQNMCINHIGSHLKLHQLFFICFSAPVLMWHHFSIFFRFRFFFSTRKV